MKCIACQQKYSLHTKPNLLCPAQFSHNSEPEVDTKATVNDSSLFAVTFVFENKAHTMDMKSNDTLLSLSIAIARKINHPASCLIMQLNGQVLWLYSSLLSNLGVTSSSRIDVSRNQPESTPTSHIVHDLKHPTGWNEIVAEIKTLQDPPEAVQSMYAVGNMNIGLTSDKKIIRMKLNLECKTFNIDAFVTDLADYLGVSEESLWVLTCEAGSTWLQILTETGEKVLQFFKNLPEQFNKKYQLIKSNVLASQLFMTPKETTTSPEVIETAAFEQASVQPNPAGLAWLKKQTAQYREKIAYAARRSLHEFIVLDVVFLNSATVIDSFLQHGNTDNVKLLFHGTKTKHFANIFRGGFNLEEAVEILDNGYYGRGYYFAGHIDNAVRYIQYSQGLSWPQGAVRTIIGSFVNLGRTKTITQLCVGKPLTPGFQSHYVTVDPIHGLPVDASPLVYEEYVVADRTRALPRFAIRVKYTGRAFVWRDANISNAENSGLLAKVRGGIAIYACDTSEKAMDLIRLKCTHNQVFVITNARHDAEGFLRSVRAAGISTPALVFTSTTSGRDWAQQIDNVSVTITHAGFVQFINSNSKVE
jgi:hypothetical protein